MTALFGLAAMGRSRAKMLAVLCTEWAHSSQESVWRTANVGEPFYFCASAPNQCGALLLFLARTYANILPWQIGICTAAFPFRECLFCLFVYNFNGILTGKNIEFFGQSHIIK